MRLSESGKMTTTLQEAFEQYDRTRSARIAGAATIHAQSVAVAMIAYHINKANAPHQARRDSGVALNAVVGHSA